MKGRYVLKRFVKRVIEKIYSYIDERIIVEENQIKDEKTKHLTMSVYELFMKEDRVYGYNRYDMIVRLLAIECEKGINDFGWDFYRRMQTARVGDDRLEDRVVRFKNLIKSYDEGGYDSNSEIELDSDFHLIDGSHRMAMAIFHHLSTINVKVRPYKTNCYYGIDFFKDNGFSDNDCRLIMDRLYEVKRYFFEELEH